jgi:uncharacterized protein
MVAGRRWVGTNGLIIDHGNMEVSPVQLLIFQPTPFCNLNCTYCYLPDRQDRRIMDVDVVRKTVQRLQQEELLDPTVSIIWHAGEPTVVRRERYAEYFAAIKEVLGNSCEVVHHFQTNATLIDDKWCSFIKEHQIAIGVSIDGPDYIHDYSRKSWSGRGTLDKTLRGVKTLQESEIEFHTISVIGDRSLGHAQEIYDFLVSLKPCLLAFNVEEQEGVHETSSLTDRSDRVERFFQELYDAARGNAFDPPVREFENACGSIANGGGSDFNTQVFPYRILTISVDGAFTTFSPELLGMTSKAYGSLELGNIRNDSLKGALLSPKYKQLSSAILAGVKRCQEACDYFDVCGGGAPANKLFETGTFDVAETRFCEQSLKIPLRIVLKDLETTLAGQGNALAEAQPGEKVRRVSLWAF